MKNKAAIPENITPIVRPSLAEIGLDMVRFFGVYALIAGVLALMMHFRS